MKEFLYVQDMMTVLEDRLIQGKSVKEIHVSVQPFEQISPSILRSLFYITLNDHGFPLVDLVVKQVGAQMQCMSCGRRFVSHAARCTCQYCGSLDCSFIAEKSIAFEVVDEREPEFCAGLSC